MDEQQFDIVIIGAGLAGLSLATRFCAPQFAHLRVAVIDPRTSFGATHTWSFFQQAPHPFMDCILPQRQWRKLQVNANGVQSASYDFTATPYCSIESTAFYEKCLKTMAVNARIQGFFGHRVDSVRALDDGGATVAAVNVPTGEAMQLEAKLVFDSRPPAGSASSRSAWIQAFAGWEITVAATGQPFAALISASEAVLMDFMPSLRDAAGRPMPTFIYLLPSSATQALVQATVFVPPGAIVPTDAALQALALQYLRTKFGELNIIAQTAEAGRIVMDAAIAPCASLQTITKIGAGGGFVRAATGYSFTRTQRACDALEMAVLRAFTAHSLGDIAQHLPVPITFQSGVVPWLDAVFLEAIGAPDLDVGKLMARLFNTVPATRLVRFLDGNARAADVLAVVVACPKWVFMRSFFVCVWRYLNAAGSSVR